MSGRAIAKEQPKEFEFTPENLEKIKAFAGKYPQGRQASAVIAVLELAQRQNDNWLPVVAMEATGTILDMPYIRVYEVATFYTMFNLAPVGENFIQICRTTPCWLRGSDEVTNACQEKLGINMNETTADGKFSMVEVECLGACVNAPVVQINDDFYEDLSAENVGKIIDDLDAGKKPKIGTQINRKNSAPVGASEKEAK